MRQLPKWGWLVLLPIGLGAFGLYRLNAPASDGAPRALAGDSRPSPKDVQKGPRFQEAVMLSGAHGLEDTRRLIEAYAAWASEPGSLEARRLLLGSLFNRDNLAEKLSGVLSAVEADATPPERDPLWANLTESLSELWTTDTAAQGMDLMFSETRPRAKSALIASFVTLATSERFKTLPQEQGQKLTNYFIDMYGQVPAGQKPEVERALRQVAGNDVADIMLGKGLGTNDHQLESERQYQQGLLDTQRALAQAPSGTPPAPAGGTQ